MHVTVEMSLIPIGTSVSLSPFVAECQRVIETAGFTPELHANGTNFEGEWEDVMRTVRACHEAVHALGAPRINTTLKIGTRTDREQSLAETVERVRRRLVT